MPSGVRNYAFDFRKADAKKVAWRCCAVDEDDFLVPKQIFWNRNVNAAASAFLENHV